MGRLVLNNYMTYTFKELDIPGVFEITPYSVSDERGSTVKIYDKNVFFNNGINFIPLESMHIFSKKNVLRGVHFQRIEEQDRLVKCISGSVFAVIVDLREKKNPKWIQIDLNNRNEVYVPCGCALGTLALEDSLILCMFGKNKYNADYATGIIWNDETLDIQWPVYKFNDDNLFISERDKMAMSYDELLKREFL